VIDEPGDSEMDSDQAVIEVNKINLSYGADHVLKDVSLKIPAGSVLGVVGRNGAGKSTFLRCLMGVAVPSSGSALLFGEQALSLSNDVRAKLGFVPQVSDHLDWLTVWAQVGLIGRFYAGWSEDYAKRLCGDFGLAPDVKVSSLSVGDQQKLALVLAMAHRPELLILDEPVASLDPITRRVFMRSLFDSSEPERALRTIVMSSHLLSDLERIVTHIAFMRDGRLQLIDSWDDLVEHYRLVASKKALEASQGVVCQRQTADGWRSIVDTRMVPGQSDTLSMNLDEFFLELNT
jgi:ABC-2 type transport system ATP-binding protein